MEEEVKILAKAVPKGISVALLIGTLTMAFNIQSVRAEALL